MLTDVRMVLSRPIVPQFICCGLVLLIIWQVYSGVFAFFLLDKAVTVDPNIEVVSALPPEKTSLTLGLNTPFFGDYVPTHLNEADVKQSMLNLTIVGIMFSDDEKTSHVIIKAATGKEQTYKVGDTLPGSVVIKRITSDGVLIRRNGTLESLSLPKKALIFGPPPKPLKH